MHAIKLRMSGMVELDGRLPVYGYIDCIDADN